MSEPNLSQHQEQALIRLYTTGDLGNISVVTIECLIHESVIMQNAERKLVITTEGKEYLEGKYRMTYPGHVCHSGCMDGCPTVPSLGWFPQEVL